VVTAYLALSDGSVYSGQSLGVLGQAVGELVFHTGMTGYQEIMTDPSYARQIIMFTSPHIGNVGICAEDMESCRVHATAMVMREVTEAPIHWRSERTVRDFLSEQQVVAISGIDTRALTIKIREQGAVSACVLAQEGDVEAVAAQAVSLARTFSGLQGQNLASEVTTDSTYLWDQGLPSWQHVADVRHGEDYHVVVMDFGVKHQMLRLLVSLGCRVTVVPAGMGATEVQALNPDGILLSNGPGDPAACTDIIMQIQLLIQGDVPIFGICLGHQLLALALGAKTKKMDFGHHGANHPVWSHVGSGGAITSQNHGFVVDESTLPKHVVVTHASLFDGTVQGIRHTSKAIWGIQGHPEASPGPHDWYDLFSDFISKMERHCAQA